MKSDFDDTGAAVFVGSVAVNTLSRMVQIVDVIVTSVEHNSAYSRAKKKSVLSDNYQIQVAPTINNHTAGIIFQVKF